MIQSVFGIILLPMTQDRRKILNELETLRDSLVSHRDDPKAIDHPLLGTFFKADSLQWIFHKDAAEELCKRSFFKRFLPSEIEEFLPKMKVKQHLKRTVIFPDDEICVILDGTVESKQHIAGKRVPVLFNQFQAGDILGFDKGDNGQTSNSTTWSICQSVVEAIWMDKRDFHDLW